MRNPILLGSSVRAVTSTSNKALHKERLHKSMRSKWHLISSRTAKDKSAHLHKKNMRKIVRNTHRMLAPEQEHSTEERISEVTKTSLLTLIRRRMKRRFVRHFYAPSPSVAMSGELTSIHKSNMALQNWDHRKTPKIKAAQKRLRKKATVQRQRKSLMVSISSAFVDGYGSGNTHSPPILRFLSKIIGGIAAVKSAAILAVLIAALATVVSVITSVFGIFGDAAKPHLPIGRAVNIVPEVMIWRPLMLAELTKYGYADQIDLVLAITMVESAGSVPDIMQSSESIGLPPNAINDPSFSIVVGVRHFAHCLEEAKRLGCDINTAIQCYNFGTGYAEYVFENGRTHSEALAERFAKMQAQQLGWESYGAAHYVSVVYQYLSATLPGTPETSGVLHSPFPEINWKEYVTSPFGWRIHPVFGDERFHAGLDLGVEYGTPVHAAAAGTVSFVGWWGGGGNAVFIDHENGLVTMYLHLSAQLVSEGSQVVAGTVIGLVGSSGDSTGAHLHFQVEKDGSPIDPATVLPN